MRLQIETDGTPFSVRTESIAITKQLAGRSSTCTFDLPVQTRAGGYDSGAVYDDPTVLYDADQTAYSFSAVPNQLSEVIVYNADDLTQKLFRGFIVGVSRQIRSKDFQVWAISCVGLEFLLSNITINKSYVGKSDREIVQDAFSVLPEITTDDSTVAELAVALDLDFKDQTLIQVLETLASISGAEWRITEAKQLSWRASGSVPASFGFGAVPDELHSPPLKKWIITSRERRSDQFANKVTMLGSFDGTGAAELRSVAENVPNQVEIGRIIEAIVVDRTITTQVALDLAASIELEKRAVQETITFDFLEDGLEVGDLVEIESLLAQLSGSWVVNTLTLKQLSPTQTRYQASVGDYRGTLAERLRELDRLKSIANPPAIPPPPNSITSDMLGDHVVTRLKIAAQAVSDAELALAAVTEDILAAGAVTNTKIADDAISTPKLQAGSVVTATLAAGSVVANKIQAGTITGVQIQAGGITAADAVFGTGAIQTADIGNAQITAAKIGSVDAGSISTGTLSVGSGGILVSGNIDGSTCTLTSLKADDIISGTLDTARLAVGSISGLKLADGTVGNIKINNDLDAGKITVGVLDCSLLTVSNLQADSITSGTLDCSLLTVENLDCGALTSGTITAAISINSGGSFFCSDGATFDNGLIVHGQLNVTGNIVSAGQEIQGCSQIGAVTIFAGTYQNATGGTIVDSSGNFVGPSVNVGSGAITGGAITGSSLTIGGSGFSAAFLGVSGPGSFSSFADVEAYLAGLASALAGTKVWMA